MKSVILQSHSECNTILSNYIYSALCVAFSLPLVQPCQTTGQKESVIKAENIVNDHGQDSSMSTQPKTGFSAYP